MKVEMRFGIAGVIGKPFDFKHVVEAEYFWVRDYGK